MRRRNITPWAYGFSALNILGFATASYPHGEAVWLARIFFVWLSCGLRGIGSTRLRTSDAIWPAQ